MGLVHGVPRVMFIPFAGSLRFVQKKIQLAVLVGYCIQ